LAKAAELRAKLEAMWQHGELASPCHLNRWNTEGFGYTRFKEFGLFWTHGTPRGPKRKPVSKCWTFLPRLYGLACRMRWHDRPPDQDPTPAWVKGL
jgi:hypothetical protein